MAFNQTHDTAFQTAVSGGGLAASNLLRSCLPSSLNLSSNCYFTANLIDAFGLRQDVSQQIAQVVVGLRPALPQNYSHASYLDIATYWDVLNSSVNAEAVISQAEQVCTDAQLPVGLIDVARNCSATAQFYYSHQFTSFIIANMTRTPGLTIASFVQSSISDEWQDWTHLSDDVLTWIGLSLILSTDNVAAIESVARTCVTEYCQILGYSGNADMAGIGAVVAFFVIAFLTTVFWVGTILGRRLKNESKYHLRNATFYAAFSFWDSIIYIAIMTSNAGYIYTFYITRSVYEGVMGAFLIPITTNAVFALISLDLYDGATEEMRGEQRTRKIAWFLVLIMHLSYSVAMFYKGWWFLSDNLFDIMCYSLVSWPVTLAKIASITQVIQLGGPFCIWMVGVFLHELRKLIPSFGKRIGPMLDLFDLDGKQRRTLLRVAEAVAILLMWFNLVAFLLVRRHAQRLYGSSFGENSFGFGQIMALGFCLQAVVLFLDRLVNYYEYYPLGHKASPSNADPAQDPAAVPLASATTPTAGSVPQSVPTLAGATASSSTSLT